MPTPRVTVYITNHNYGPYLDEAIQSILRQTITDFELLVIDDGSTDGSREIIERYADCEGIYPVFQQNVGLATANNIALRMARGKYIIRLDADDYLDPHCLAILTDVLDRSPDVGLVFPDYYEVDAAGQVLSLRRRNDFQKVTLFDQPAHGACTLVRCDLLRELGGYDKTFPCQDGYDIWVRFIRRHTVRNVNLPLFYYRQHGRNLTSDENRLLHTRAEILKKQATRLGQQLFGLAVIPVRDRRTDPRSIAMRPLGNRRVIDWTIEPALAARRLRRVIVTTPDEEILEYVAERYGARVMGLPRDRQLARMNSFTDETVVEALRRYSEQQPRPDVVVELFVEAPFRTPQLIDSAIDSMEIFETDRVIAVRPETAPLYWHRGKGLETIRYKRALRCESDDIYRDLGVIRATRSDRLEADGPDGCTRLGHIVADERSGFVIRSDWHLELAALEAARRDAVFASI